MTTRTKAAGKNLAKAVQNVASAATNHTADADGPDSQQPERLPLADAKPLLFRLEHSLVFGNDEAQTLQPKIGASCKVGDSSWGRRSKGTETVWLPAAAWEGMATIIRQTPDWQRQNVAMFLEIVASNIREPIGGVLIEMVDEVRNDPYRDVPETDRRAEVASLKRLDVQDGWAHDALVIGKGDKERNVFFGDDAQRAIRAYLAARSDDLVPLFLRHDNRRGNPGPGGEHWRLSLQSIWCLVRRYAAEQGIKASPHSFRHLKASTLLNRGASLSEVQDVLGHSSPETTKSIYAHYTPKFLREAVEKYSATPAELVAELEVENARRREGRRD